jgi:hypothetical protein
MTGMCLRLITGLRCTVCDGLMDDEKRTKDQITAALFGAEQYAICIGCGEAVGDTYMCDPNYRARWRRRARRLNA